MRSSAIRRGDLLVQFLATARVTWESETNCTCDERATLRKRPAQALLAPFQLGVAVKGGAEAIVHTVRRLITHHLDSAVSPDWALLQVDFSNAFNLVRRDVFCQSILSIFLRWVPGVLGAMILRPISSTKGR
jgi:hypothetical protein